MCNDTEIPDLTLVHDFHRTFSEPGRTKRRLNGSLPGCKHFALPTHHFRGSAL
jgi:hypothetical protein